MPSDDLVVAMTGASGTAYGVRLVEVLLRAGRRVHFTMSPSATVLLTQELERTVSLEKFDPAALLGDAVAGLDLKLLQYHDHRDFRAGIASGSFLTAGMVVCPCSMGTLAAIAHGISTNLIHRAADVHLKERRKLILVPRETPYNNIHLENMLRLSQAGARILPASPGFYHRPKTIDDLVEHLCFRILDQFDIPHSKKSQWTGEEVAEN